MIMEQGYEIRSYESEMISEATELLKDFWGGDADERRAYLQWKYEDNPNTDDPLAMVAIHKGRMVGFRGYFATDWCVGDRGLRTTILTPGDTFTHPEHRRRGLSVVMGKKAMQIYSDRYRIFLNLSATKLSAPGYLKMGYFPLTVKSYLNSYSPVGLSRFIMRVIFPTELNKRRKKLGQYDDVVVSDRPRPSQMASIISMEGEKYPRCLTLHQDKDYFEWRFKNDRNEYIFYYFIKGGAATGYMVVRCPPGSPRGYVIDYGDKDGTSLNSILKLSIKKRHFDVLSIYDYCLEARNKEIFRRYGFSSQGIMRVLEKTKRGEWPLFVRPVKVDCAENDWHIGGLDFRKKDNWRIKEICSDSV